MPRWILFLVVLAIIAGVFGFTGIAGFAIGLAKLIFFLLLVLIAASVIFGRAS